MSSILKALRRLEEEKAQRLDSPADIARDILRAPRKKHRSQVGWLLVPVCVVVSASAGGLFLWSGLERDQKGKIIISQEAAAVPSQAPPLAPVAPPAIPAPVVPAEPEIVEVKMPPQPASAGMRSEAVLPVPPPAERKSTATSTTKAQPPSPPPPKLAVSDIAFQAEREARLAIINDLPVMEGTVIEGVRVEEILVDRVRFSREGKMFEVELKKE